MEAWKSAGAAARRGMASCEVGGRQSQASIQECLCTCSINVLLPGLGHVPSEEKFLGEASLNYCLPQTDVILKQFSEVWDYYR